MSVSSMSDWKMQRKEVEQLIALYKKNPCLWDYRSSQYKRTDLKKQAWQNFSHIFGKEVDEIKKKIKNLRSAYVSEKKKVDEYSGVTPAYRPSLFYYDEMSFLDAVVVLRKVPSFQKFETADSVDSIEFSEQPIDNNIEEQFLSENDDVSPPMSPERSIESKKRLRKKQHRLAPYYSKLNAAVNTLEQATLSTANESIYTAFGKTIALQLSQLTPLDATATMSEIHQVLTTNVIKSMIRRRGVPAQPNNKTGNANNDIKLSALLECVEKDLDDENQSLDDSL